MLKQRNILLILASLAIAVLVACGTETKPNGPAGKIATETTLTPEQAQAELAQLGIDNTARAFVDSARAGNLARAAVRAVWHVG